MKIKKLTLVFLVAAGLLLWILKQPSSLPPRESIPLPHECYVWQRVWNDDLRDAIRLAENDLKGFTVLSAEIDVRPDRQKQQIMSVDYAFLSSLSEPVGIAIRINPYCDAAQQN